MKDTKEKINLKNFNTAIDLSSKKFCYEELIKMINSDDIIIRQIAILNLKSINSKKDAKLLSSMLTEQDGKIREATAFKLKELALNPKYTKYFIQDENFYKFMNAFMDINGNICRMIINLTKIEEFKLYLSKYLPNILYKLITEIKTINLKSKQYILSKKNFQLYWNLEALSRITKFVNYDSVSEILEYTSHFPDYTIREKSAKIANKYNIKKLNALKNILKSDSNYYVKRCACSSDE